ncbi:MAG: four helix bundle protein [Planctomycetes bacterium]|nr:four helix bundle protein [Planctomycetota bacterium]
MSPDDLSERLLDFSSRVGKVVNALPPTRLGSHIANQLIRSGTAPGAHYEEGRAAESRKDFLHKLGIALKEARESCYWLRLIARSELLSEARLADLTDEASQLCRILGKSIVTAKQKDPK